MRHLVSPSGWLGTRAAADAACVATALLEPLLCAQSQFSVQLGTGIFAMDEVAEPSADAPFTTIQSATRFPEIRHW